VHNLLLVEGPQHVILIKKDVNGWEDGPSCAPDVAQVLHESISEGDFRLSVQSDQSVDGIGVNICLEDAMLIHAWLLALDDVDAKWYNAHVGYKVTNGPWEEHGG
jgi:hypothetical protein